MNSHVHPVHSHCTPSCTLHFECTLLCTQCIASALPHTHWVAFWANSRVPSAYWVHSLIHVENWMHTPVHIVPCQCITWYLLHFECTLLCTQCGASAFRVHSLAYTGNSQCTASYALPIGMQWLCTVYKWKYSQWMKGLNNQRVSQNHESIANE